MMKYPGGSVILDCIDSDGESYFCRVEGPFHDKTSMLSCAARLLDDVEQQVSSGLIRSPTRLVLDFA